MSEVEVNANANANGAPKNLDLAATKRALSSSSTALRITHLRTIDGKISQKSLSNAELSQLVHLIFATHALYADRESRLAVQKCLASTITADSDPKILSALVTALRQETEKQGIAVSSAFVLVEWCGLFMHHLAESPLWDELAKDILLADANALDRCLEPGSRKSVAHSALVVTRRGMRKLFSHSEFGQKRLLEAVNILTAKGTQSIAKNSVLIGTIAGVSSRKDNLKPILESCKPKIYEFFTREIVGSRTALSEHVVLSLGDFFSSFTTLDEVSKELIPALEKCLLRSPEVVLGGVLTSLVQSLPESLDLSQILDQKLLKPILSNIKSTNAVIRAGATMAFTTIIARCHNPESVTHITDEITTPLKGGKLASADHRVLHAQMLEVVPLSQSSAEKIIHALAVVTGKEGNESALLAETATLARGVTFLLNNKTAITKPVLDAFAKGLADKKPPSRRAWLLRVGSILEILHDIESTTPEMSSFVEAVIPKLITNFTEVVANAATSSQNGLIVGAYILTAISPLLHDRFPGSSADTALSKAAVPKHSLTLDSKHAFLLNHRIYSKATGEDDLRWFSQALTSIFNNLGRKSDDAIIIAWSEAIIYLISSPMVSSKVQKETSQELSKLYTQHPSLISSFIVKGLWAHLQQGSVHDKDQKGYSLNLVQVLRAICLSPKDLEKAGQNVGIEERELLACSLLALTRPTLIPRANWIELCLRMELDPGDLVRKHQDELLKEIETRTSFSQQSDIIKAAAYNAAADLAFVAPETTIPQLLKTIGRDLDAQQLKDVGPVEAAIFRTPEGTCFVDVLAKKSQQTVDKNNKDYDILKWEEELRSQLEKKKGQQRKLTADETAKVKAQLKKESEIRW